MPKLLTLLATDRNIPTSAHPSHLPPPPRIPHRQTRAQMGTRPASLTPNITPTTPTYLNSNEI